MSYNSIIVDHEKMNNFKQIKFLKYIPVTMVHPTWLCRMGILVIVTTTTSCRIGILVIVTATISE
jgi:hypothetical protein